MRGVFSDHPALPIEMETTMPNLKALAVPALVIAVAGVVWSQAVQTQSGRRMAVQGPQGGF